MPAILLALVSGHALAQDDGWSLAWEDEFEGSALDLDSWSFQTGNGSSEGLPAGWGNNERQYYTNFDRNLSVSDGTLKITAIRENFGGAQYTSARIRTKGKQDFLYGRFEGRMKIPSTSGVWPAFWMLPTASPYGGWASSGEIDIMESVNTANRIYGTIHYGAGWPNNQSNGNTVQDGRDFSADFHTYALEWEPDQLRWYIDGELFHTVNSNQWYSSQATGNPQAPFDVAFHVLLNVAVGGNFPGDPNGSAVFPQTLEVDYVKVYERIQSPFGGDAHPIPGVIEAEDFDIGSNGQSYNDCDPENNGGQYRSTGVDIEQSTESGYDIGWMCEGEWLEYTVDVQQEGDYLLEARVASQSTGGQFRIEIEGEDQTGPIAVPVTGGWQDWQTVSADIHLQAGTQVIRFANLSDDTAGYNFNSMTFTAQDGPCSGADVKAPYGELNFFDVSEFLSLFAANDPLADLSGDGSFNFFDISDFLTLFAQGCP